jgi:hypothetical protein
MPGKGLTLDISTHPEKHATQFLCTLRSVTQLLAGVTQARVAAERSTRSHLVQRVWYIGSYHKQPTLHPTFQEVSLLSIHLTMAAICEYRTMRPVVIRLSYETGTDVALSSLQPGQAGSPSSHTGTRTGGDVQAGKIGSAGATAPPPHSRTNEVCIDRVATAITSVSPSSKTLLSRFGLVSAPASSSGLLVVSRKDVFLWKSCSKTVLTGHKG